jgi:hypothetical protein
VFGVRVKSAYARAGSDREQRQLYAGSRPRNVCTAALEEDERLEYGCAWSSTPLPGGVRTTKTEIPTPACGSPSNSEAVGLNFISPRSKTFIQAER